MPTVVCSEQQEYSLGPQRMFHLISLGFPSSLSLSPALAWLVEESCLGAQVLADYFPREVSGEN